MAASTTHTDNRIEVSLATLATTLQNETLQYQGRDPEELHWSEHVEVQGEGASFTSTGGP